jgi:carboxymethylenebutenolidase
MDGLNQTNDLKEHFATLTQRQPLTRRAFAVTSLATGFTMAAGPLNAQSIITTDTQGLTAGEVQIPVSDGQIPAYRAKPATGTRFATILVCQEVFGVHEHIKDVCRRLAKLGYQAVAPELYTRQGSVAGLTDMQAVMAIVARVPDAQVMSDFDATVRWAATDGGDPQRLGMTGFCWGGRITWLYTAHNPTIKAAVAWYGPLNPPSNELRPRQPVNIASELHGAAVLGLYGGADTGITQEHVEQMRAALRAANNPSEIVVYPDTPHGFHADYRSSYRAEAARDGWNRLQAWFRQHGVAATA